MKNKIIKNRINTNKMFVFLCGSYYSGTKDDKRYLIKEHITEYSNLYPIIIDEAFNIDGFIDKSLNVSLMEEIVANIAHYTIVIVESFSSSAELGLFSSSSLNNQLVMLYANPRDIENNKVGYFIENAFKQSNKDAQNIEIIIYRPAVSKMAHHINWIDEYYYFPRNEIPKKLRDSILRMSGENKIEFDTVISGISSEYSLPINHNEIKYIKTSDTLNIKISIFLLFHICLKLYIDEYSNKPINDVLKSIIDESKIIIKNTLILNDKDLKKNIKSMNNINYLTELNNEYAELVKHIIHIIILFMTDDNVDNFDTTYENISIITEIDSKVLDYTVFDELNLSRSILIKPSKNNFDRIEIFKNNKKRDVIKYSDNEQGVNLKKLHNLILDKLTPRVKFNSNSYAYKEGTGIKKFISSHLKSSYFIKYDIENFFNSINRVILAKKINEILELDEHVSDLLTLVDSVFIKHGDKYVLPLGFTISPILSEIYMTDFDNYFTDYSKKNNLKYTRYADDICFSSYKEMNHQEIKKEITSQLELIGLSLNQNKEKVTHLRRTGDHVRMLGVNLVKKDQTSKLEMTVGGRYIKSIAKEASRMTNLNYDNADYISSRINGKIGFLKHINAEDQIKLVKLINLYNTKEKAEEILKMYSLQ